MVTPGISTAAAANASLAGKSIISSNRTGYFIAIDSGSNIDTNEWKNSQSGNTGVGFKRTGGVVHNNSTPHNFEFDGSNDRLSPGDGAGYGGNPFTIDLSQYFTIGIWWRYDSSGDNYCWVFGANNSGGASLSINSSTGKPEFRANSSSANITSSYACQNHKWYYIAISSSPNNTSSFDGDIDANMYVFGVDSPGFVGSAINTGGSGVTAGDQNMDVGYVNGATTAVTVADSRCANIHMYEASNSAAKLTESQLRQNFEVEHDMIDDRVYGANYGAISG